MTQALASAIVRYKGLCRCNVCGKVALSSSTNTLELPTMAAGDLKNEISIAIINTFVQPPIGWSVNGRGNFRCPEHIT